MIQMLTYKIEFFTYWHTGSGLSGGADANLTVIKNQHELPFIPGRTLKGLLREAAETLHELAPELVTNTFISTVFGVGAPPDENVNGQQASCFFSNAELSQFLTAQLNMADKKEQKKMLYTTLAATAINSNGQARDHSLRQIQVSIPLTLYASIETFPSGDEEIAQMERCFQWIKKMGTHRSRGLGRCTFSLYKPT